MTTACAIVLSPGHVYPDHEEAPSRFMYLGGWEAKPYAGTIHFISPQPAAREPVTAVHSERMLQKFEAACRQGPGITDYAPTFVTPSTYTDAFLAAGAALDCTRAREVLGWAPTISFEQGVASVVDYHRADLGLA